jgi:ATP-dependent Clp endopeptidase proteolytic subunit ClpP
MAEVTVKDAKLITLAAEAEAYAAEARKTNAEAARVEFELAKVQREVEAMEARECDRRGIFDLDGEVNSHLVVHLADSINGFAHQNPGADITIRIFSPGGSVFDGFVLFDQLRELSNQGHTIITEVLGYAASMGGVIAQAGDIRRMGRNAYVMIHNCGGGAIGKTFELEDEVAFMKRLEERMVNIYANNSKLSKRKLQAGFKRRDWWLDSEECEEAGIVDKVIG